MGDREGRGRGRNTTTVVDLSESNNVTFVVFSTVLMGKFTTGQQDLTPKILIPTSPNISLEHIALKRRWLPQVEGIH